MKMGDGGNITARILNFIDLVIIEAFDEAVPLYH